MKHCVQWLSLCIIALGFVLLLFKANPAIISTLRISCQWSLTAWSWSQHRRKSCVQQCTCYLMQSSVISVLQGYTDLWPLTTNQFVLGPVQTYSRRNTPGKLCFLLIMQSGMNDNKWVWVWYYVVVFVCVTLCCRRQKSQFERLIVGFFYQTLRDTECPPVEIQYVLTAIFLYSY